MAEEIYYKKQGGKYVPVSYYDDQVLDSVGQGATLIVKQKNLTMRKHNIDIDRAPLQAAMMSLQDEVSNVVYKMSEARPSARELTEQQRSDWQAFIDKHGESFRYIEYPSCREIAEQLLERFQAEVIDAHANPAVKEAYEHYKFLLALTIKEKNTL